MFVLFPTASGSDTRRYPPGLQSTGQCPFNRMKGVVMVKMRQRMAFNPDDDQLQELSSRTRSFAVCQPSGEQGFWNDDFMMRNVVLPQRAT